MDLFGICYYLELHVDTHNINTVDPCLFADQPLQIQILAFFLFDNFLNIIHWKSEYLQILFEKKACTES